LIKISHVPRVEARAAMLSLDVSVVLMLLKFLAYFVTGSAAVFSDALESIVNVFASGFAFYELWFAHRPADTDHPNGHGKIEFLSAMVEGGVISFAALVIAAKAIDTLLFRQMQIESLNLGVLLVGVATAVNAGVGIFLLSTGRKTGSLTLEADGKHLLSDAVTSVAAIVALLGVWLTKWVWIDSAFALGIAIYLLFAGYHLVRRASAGLLDELDEHDDARMRAILDAPLICSYHKLRHRHSGRYHWVDFHILVPGQTDVQTGHAIATKIEAEIEAALGEADATAHIEPCGDPQCPECHSLNGLTIPSVHNSYPWRALGHLRDGLASVIIGSLEPFYFGGHGWHQSHDRFGAFNWISRNICLSNRSWPRARRRNIVGGTVNSGRW